jgi:D-alanyl-D-alanine carboxypeptidase/D-alanyl-D-alanine-endopeptidase (penicillin-binding protein 4)
MRVRASVRRSAAVLAAVLLAPAGAAAQTSPDPELALRRALDAQLTRAGTHAGAYVVDLAGGRVLYSRRSTTRRNPASVEKLYTTSTALRRYGPAGRLRTAVYGSGTIDPAGTYTGDLYLKGYGDPTFGSTAFSLRAYGTGATVDALAQALITRLGIAEVRGRILGDETYFDRRRGTIYSRFALNTDVGGALSALAFNRGLANERGTAFALRPADFSADRLVAALEANDVPVSGTGEVGTRPAGTPLLAQVSSPPMSTLTRLTDVPSDNYLAEMLLKGLGARFGAGGTSYAGAAVVRDSLAPWGIRPSVVDGSGLSRLDRTSPREVVTLLRRMAADPAGPALEASLPVAARTGTLASRMRGSAAAGRCRAKTGTLSDVSALAGYCDARTGSELAFAFLMEHVNVARARAVQDRMAALLAAYRG